MPKITASELGRLEGKHIAQIHYDGESCEIVVEDVQDEYGNEVDRNLRIIARDSRNGVILSIW